MIIGQEMAEIRHGGGVPYGPIFGVCAVWPVFWRLRAGQKSSNTTCEFNTCGWYGTIGCDLVVPAEFLIPGVSYPPVNVLYGRERAPEKGTTED